MKTKRLTMAQALTQHLQALRITTDSGATVPYCAGVYAIFGHGNVAGLGEALYQTRAQLPVYRAHNEQAMAHAAIAYAKAQQRERIMAVTTSIGPGATNLVTAAALAHVNRLPTLFLPGDIFVHRAPDPVLQQAESFSDGTVSANDALRPVVRYFDRIVHPEQILSALPRALAIMTDPAQCGPTCLALPQDVQAQAFDCPESFLYPETLRIRRPEADLHELAQALRLIRAAKKPFIIVGGGVLYSQASAALTALIEMVGIPVGETQAGKSALPWDHALNLGAVGVTGSPAANAFAAEADLIIALGTRLSDFTTGSHSLFPTANIVALNVQVLDALKLNGQSVICDARCGLIRLAQGLAGWRVAHEWQQRAHTAAQNWRQQVQHLTTATVSDTLPYDAEVIGAVRDSTANSPVSDVVICAAGTLPAELHKLWRAAKPGNYHVEYGFSCMGYEIAAGLGVKQARPDAEVIVMVGDGSYMMLNAEISTSVLLNLKIIVVVLDNRGFGCISRLQDATGSPQYNNLLADCVATGATLPVIDFAAHATSMGATGVKVGSIAALQQAMVVARAAPKTQVIVIDTSHQRTTQEGGCWWEVAIPAVSQYPTVQQAHIQYETARLQQKRT